MKKTGLGFLFIAFLANAKAQNIQEYRSVFEYDKGTNLAGQILSSSDSSDGIIQNIVFSSVNGVQVTGCLILPKHKIQEFPVVIFMPDMTQDRDIFMPEALHLASEAFASLILDSPMDRPENNKFNFHNYTEPRMDFSAYRQSGFDIRRAVDFLEENERIDQNRIAFVGSGTGAMTGAIISGVENRISMYILMNNYYCFMSELKNSNEPTIVKARNLLETDQAELYQAMLKPLEPENYLPYHRNSYVFFQFTQNGYNESAREAFQITKEPKKQKIYKANKTPLAIFEEAVRDRKNWLINHL